MNPTVSLLPYVNGSAEVALAVFMGWLVALIAVVALFISRGSLSRQRRQWQAEGRAIVLGKDDR